MRSASLLARQVGSRRAEVMRPEVQLTGVIGEHVVGDRQDRCCDGDRRFLGAALPSASRTWAWKLPFFMSGAMFP
jgi:hypothetical protein